jgi:hypothetical protein
MKHPERLKALELPTDIRELAAAVEALPGDVRGKLERLMGEVLNGARNRQIALWHMREALAEQALEKACLRFDLDATRQERDALRNGNGEDQ